MTRLNGETVTAPLLNTSFGTATKATAKAAPGRVFGFTVSNVNAAVRYFQIHAKATAPAGTDVPLYSFPIPAGTATVPASITHNESFFGQNGALIPTGVSWAISTTVATFTDSATNTEHIVHVHFS